MKKIKILFIVLIAMLCFTGCTNKQIVSQTITDKQFIAEHYETVTDYVYKYNWWTGDFVLVPEIKTQVVPDEWKLQIKIAYDDGSSSIEWMAVSKAVFDKYEIGNIYAEEI